jgi:Ca2+-binding RTX toxin-like protein
LRNGQDFAVSSSSDFNPPMKKNLKTSGSKVRKAIVSGVVLSAGIASFLQADAQSTGKNGIQKKLDGKLPLRKQRSLRRDALDGNSGNDLMLRAATPGCAITGTAAGETITFGGSYCDTAFGLAGDDMLYAYTTNTDTLLADGGIGADSIGAVGYGPVILYGGADADTVIGGSPDGNLFIDGGTEADYLYGYGGNGMVAVSGDSGDDIMFGISYYAYSYTSGGDNDDLVYGVSYYADASTHGGSGNDVIRSGTIYGDNVVTGDMGDDIINGVSVSGPSNFMDGGDGNDILSVGFTYTYAYGAGAYSYTGSYLYGGSGDDQLLAHVNNDTLVAGTGADIMRAYTGDDLLIAEDILLAEANGGPGTDLLMIDFSLDMDATSSLLLGLERMDINGTGSNTLSISSSTVVHDATAGVNALTSTDSTLVVDGGADDNVALTGAWSMTGTGTIGASNYDIYETSDLARLWINQDVNVILSAVTDAALSENLTVSPIPTTGPVDLRFVSPASGLMKIQVRDLTGRQLYHEDRFILQGSYEGKLDLTAFSAGVYLMEVQMGDARTTRKLIVE